MQTQAVTLTSGGARPYSEACIGESAYTVRVALKDRVIALREAKGWSQAELARRAGLHGQTIHNIEHGRNRGGWKSRQGLAGAFGIPVAALDQSEVAAHGESPFSSVASLSDKDLLDGVFTIVRELERRGVRPDPPPDSPPPPKPPARPRRHR